MWANESNRANKSDKSLVSVCKIWTNNNNICWLSNWSHNEWIHRQKKEREKNIIFIDGIGTHQYFMIISHHNRYSTSQSTETPINLIRKKVIIIIIFSNYCSSIKRLCFDIVYMSVQSIGIFFITLFCRGEQETHCKNVACGEFLEFYWTCCYCCIDKKNRKK